MLETSRVRRAVFVGVGFACLAIGAVGVVVPLLPTTPFLLAAAYLFLRSSPRWHAWLLQNRVVGGYLRAYLEEGVVPARTKVVALALLWTTLGVSVIVVGKWYVAVALLVVGVAVTVHIVLLGRGKRDR